MVTKVGRVLIGDEGFESGKPLTKNFRSETKYLLRFHHYDG
jgi:hypothetical protein